MQQLFPAEGETIPKLRFPEFRDSGEWKEKPLGEIWNIVPEEIFQVEVFNRIGRNIPWI